MHVLVPMFLLAAHRTCGKIMFTFVWTISPRHWILEASQVYSTFHTWRNQAMSQSMRALFPVDVTPAPTTYISRILMSFLHKSVKSMLTRSNSIFPLLFRQIPTCCWIPELELKWKWCLWLAHASCLWEKHLHWPHSNHSGKSSLSLNDRWKQPEIKVCSL